MEYQTWRFVIWAVALGGLSAVSLPLGSLAALRRPPRSWQVSILAAFGAGALVAALSVELVAPTVFALHGGGGDAQADFLALVLGAALGGVLFVLLDQLVNAHGGFLRKTATSIAFFREAERVRQAKLLATLAQWPLFQGIPSEHVGSLVAMVRPSSFADGEPMARQGEESRALFLVVEGSVRVTRDGIQVGVIDAGNAVGMIPLVAGIPNPGTATAQGAVKALALAREDVARLRELSPTFDQACRALASERLEALGRFEAARTERAVQWAQEAGRALKTGAPLPTAEQLRRAKEEHGGAPLAIWLGLLIDGIPESFVIGSGLWMLLQAKAGLPGGLRFADVVPFTLIAGLFLSNFPEALASSANMWIQGWGKRRILAMWVSLMAITAVGAGAGYLLAAVLDPTWLVFAQGLAAGAMLTMIAAAMIPEAVHMGNANAVGLGTLAGFLSAIAFALLES